MFGERLKRLRKARGLSATRLGAAAGIEANGIFKLEGGTSKEPGFFVGIRLSEVLGVSPRELAFGEPRPPDLTLRLDGVGLAVEVTPEEAIDAKRKRAMLEMIATALTKVDGTVEIMNKAVAESPTLESSTLEELRVTVAEFADALAEVQERLSQLEGKPSKERKRPRRSTA